MAQTSVKEWPLPVVRTTSPFLAALLTSATTSASDFGRSKNLGSQETHPDQFFQPLASFFAAFAERVDHRLAGHFAALKVIGADVKNNLGFFDCADGVNREDRNARVVGFANDLADRLGVSRAKNDRVNTTDNKLLDLIVLVGHLVLGVALEHLEAHRHRVDAVVNRFQLGALVDNVFRRRDLAAIV